MVVRIHLDEDFSDVMPLKNHGKAVYIINFEEIAYHQNEVLYIIIAKENTAYG
ncbi:MAG: hypothetical protein IJY79_03870 [Clostridia bacterium]|nr:hypothetical protein [Clostridia bacterium]